MPEKQELELSHSEGKPDAIGVDAVNQVLRPVGVRISQVPIPTGAHPILKESSSRPSPNRSTRNSSRPSTWTEKNCWSTSCRTTN